MSENSRKIIIVSPAYPYRGGQALLEAHLHHAITQFGYETSTVTYTLLYPTILFPGKVQYDQSAWIPYEHSHKIHRIINSINPITWEASFAFIKKEKPNAVIFVWWTPFLGPALGYFARRLRKSSKNTTVIFIVENYISHEHRWYDAFITKMTLRFAHFFISQSTYITEQLTLNFPEKKVFQTTLSVNDCFDFKKYTKESARKELNITTKNVILFFGLISPYKGLEKLIEAFTAMRHHDTTLLIVGESYEHMGRYTRQINKSNLAENILLHNKFINNENIELYFKSADVLVLPYYSGTQSGILMMAYAFGVPVVATNVGGSAELIINYKTGLVATNNNIEHLKPALESILENKNSISYENEIMKLSKSLGYQNLEKVFNKVI